MRYSTSNDLGGTKQANAATYKTQLTLTAATATLTRGKIYDVLIGTNGTPADNPMEFDISRQTTAATGTAAVPVALESGDRAAGTVGVINATVEGGITATSSVFYIGLNQRASYRWVAAPGSELIIPNVNLNGFALRSRSATYTGTSTAQAYHEE